MCLAKVKEDANKEGRGIGYKVVLVREPDVMRGFVFSKPKYKIGEWVEKLDSEIVICLVMVLVVVKSWLLMVVHTK